MENPEDKLPIEEIESSNTGYEYLLHLITSILVLVIMVSGAVNLLLLRLWKTSANDLNVMRPQFQNMVALYQKNDEPNIERIVKRFQEFGASNPDFAPILAKYGFAIPGSTAPGAGKSPASSPVPAPAPKK